MRESVQFHIESVNKLLLELLSCSVIGGKLQAVINVDTEFYECAIIFFSFEHDRASGIYCEFYRE
jgi:hypothetical protein